MAKAKKTQSKNKAKTKKPVKKAAAKKAGASKKTVKAPAKKKAVAKKAAPAKSAKKTTKTPIKTSSALLRKPAALAKIDWSRFLTPLDDRLIVQIVVGERLTAGGLYLPEIADVSGNQSGQVIAIGRGCKNKKGQIRPMDVKIGDKVLFSEFAGTKMELENVNVKILRESDILGIVEE